MILASRTSCGIVSVMLRILSFFFAAILPAAACIWDRDTLREEAKGKLDTVKAITGWFDRYPPHYYEMRLERVTEELKANPKALDLYDDAGVACSRLGRHDESIEWMAKKKAVLDSLPMGSANEERYRYLSNLGTFHLLRWIARPQEVRSADLSDLEVSEAAVAQALVLNPGAHFGREKFQMMLIRWLLEKNPFGADKSDQGNANFLNLEGKILDRAVDILNSGDFTYEEARLGVTGLIQLGAAWQSVDTFRTLQMCLHGEGHSYISHLSYLRQKELSDSGARSLHPSAKVRDQITPISSGGFENIDRVDRFYREARRAADTRNSAWTDYQEKRFALGMHPDTHPDFWSEWKEPGFPKMPGPTLTERMERNIPLTAVGLIVLVLGSLFAVSAAVKKILRLRLPAHG